MIQDFLTSLNLKGFTEFHPLKMRECGKRGISYLKGNQDSCSYQMNSNIYSNKFTISSFTCWIPFLNSQWVVNEKGHTDHCSTLWGLGAPQAQEEPGKVHTSGCKSKQRQGCASDVYTSGHAFLKSWLERGSVGIQPFHSGGEETWGPGRHYLPMVTRPGSDRNQTQAA